MPISLSMPPAVIACPGGEDFALKLAQKISEKENNEYKKAHPSGLQHKNLSVSDLLIPLRCTRFANGEIKTEILDSIRGREVYIVQDVYAHVRPNYFGSQAHQYSVNDHLMTLFTAIDAIKSCTPGLVTCILPAYPYARQHKRKSREGLSAAMVGSILEFMHVDRILTLDIHSRDIDNAFRRLQLTSLHASYEILRSMVKLINPKMTNMVVVAPDTGAVDRNKYYANSLGCPLAVIYKERNYNLVSESADHSNIVSLRLLGDVYKKTVFLADDILGTGGTLVQALKELRKLGADRVIIGISLPLFSADAASHLDKAYKEGYFYRLISTNAINHTASGLLDYEWYISAGVEDLFAEAVVKLHHNGSLSLLLNNQQLIQDLLKD